MKSNNITTDRTLNALRRHFKGTFLLLSLLTLGAGQMWGDSGDFYNMHLKYSFEGSNKTMEGSDNGTGMSVDAGTLTSGSLILTGVYLKCWDDWGSNFKSSGGQLCYTNKGGSTEYVTGLTRSSKSGNNYEYQKSNVGLTIASYDQASGSFTFESWGQTWGDNWGDRYFPKSSGHYTINYKIAPPAVSSFSVSLSNVTGGTGTSSDPYVIANGTTTTFTVTGSKAHTDANSSFRVKFGTGSYSTTTTKSYTPTSTKQSVTVYGKYYNSTASLSGTESNKTIYYIEGAAVPSLAMSSVSPATLNSGETVTINVTRSNSSATISYQYSTNGSTWNSLTPASTSNSGQTATWVIPASTATTTYYFRAQMTDGSTMTTSSASVTAYGKKTIWVRNSKNWSTFNVHSFSGSTPEAAWPGNGTRVVATNGTWKQIKLSSKYTGFILNDGTNQTPDLLYANYTDGSCYAIDINANGDGKFPLPTTTVDCKPTNHSGYTLFYGNDGKNGDGGTDASFTLPWAFKDFVTTSGTTSQVTLTATAGDIGKVYEFKIINGTGSWYGYKTASGGKIESSISNQTMSTSYGNGRLCIAVPGTYTITFNSSGTKLSITFPDGNYIRGDFNSWGWDHALTPTGNANEYSCTFSLSANQTWTAPDHGFKVVFGGVHYGKNSTSITRAANSATPLSSSGANIGLKTDLAGTYTFTYNSSSKTITITYPAAFTVTYNANGATGGSLPAGSGTTYYASGSNVTLATNTGILYKTGNAFNGWNTLSGGGGTHYASGGTLSGINANKTLYAEWKANDNHMYFYNKDNWSPVAAHMWSAANDPERSYPGRTMSVHQGKVYKIDYRSDVQHSVVFNNNYTGSGTEYKTGDLTIADGNSGDHWFYNDEVKTVTTGGIHHGWSQYIMVAGFPTSTVAAVVGEKVTITPVLAWAEDISSTDIEISSSRTSGSTNVNAVISGSNIIVSGIAKGDAVFTITYHYVHPTTPAINYTITKTLNVSIKDGITIQSKVPKNDDHWVYSNCMKVHYWNHGLSDGDITMAWVKEDASYTYYQTFVPLGTDGEIDFLFYYDNFDDAWRKTQDITNVTASGCYTINHGSGLEAQRNAVRAADRCVDTWQVQITMNNGDIFTSNAVENSTDVISFFAPSNASSDPSYRKGTVTLEHNGATAATLSSPGSPSATFSQSGVYTAKVNTSTGALTNVALYTGNYYIRTDPSSGGWDNYLTDPLNKMTHFNRNPNFQNETFSYYWVDNVAKSPGDPVNIKATVANDYNPVLCGFSADETVTREEHGLNLRFGYEPTTNDLIRGILRGSNENNFLNVIDGGTGNVYRDAACQVLLSEAQYTSNSQYSKMLDKSNWVYELNAYAKIDDTHRAANVYLKSYFGGVHYLLGMVKDAETGLDTGTPISLTVFAGGSTYETYRLRVVYDFKTNRLFAAWAPADISISSNMNVDADVMFLRHEQGDVSQISFANTSAKVTELNKAIFAVEIADDRSTSLGNRELHYFFSLPFDCYVKDIFGIGGFMEYWGIQYYDGAERARIGWFVETPTFWKWLGENDMLEAGKGYLLSIDKKALQTGDQWKSVHFMDFVNGVWTDQGEFSILTLYFPSAGSGFSMGSATATGATKVITYPNEPCSIKRDDRDQKDSNWKCIGTPGYKNMTMTGYTATSPAPPVWDGHTPPNFLYEFNEQTTTATYKKGTYTVRNGSTWTYHAFHSYMVQYAGTINWGDYTAGNGPSHIVARRAPQNEMSQATNVEIDLLSEDSTSLDRTFVWLREDATAGYDQNYDLNKMVESYANQIYSLSDHDIPFAANVMPYETDTVRLVVNIVNPGEFTFSMLKDEHFGLTPILYDMYKSEQIDLTSADYTVELDYGKYTDRFFLLFSPVKPVATAIETTEDGTQNVLSGEAIYDVLGRRVSTITPGHLYIVNGEKRIAQ